MDTIRGGRRREVVELFRAGKRPLSAREIADELGLHINTVRFHLDTLVRHGVLHRADGESSGPGRPASRYALAPGMDRSGPRNYKLLAEMLLSHLAEDPDPPGAAVRAGQAWGRYLVPPPAPGQRLTDDEALSRLSELMADVGFDPQTSADDADRVDMRLRHCPFLELAEVQHELICAMHLGLMRGALDHLGTPLHAESLTPFAEPHTCISHLSADPRPHPNKKAKAH